MVSQKPRKRKRLELLFCFSRLFFDSIKKKHSRKQLECSLVNVFKLLSSISDFHYCFFRVIYISQSCHGSTLELIVTVFITAYIHLHHIAPPWVLSNQKPHFTLDSLLLMFVNPKRAIDSSPLWLNLLYFKTPNMNCFHIYLLSYQTWKQYDQKPYRLLLLLAKKSTGRFFHLAVSNRLLPTPFLLKYDTTPFRNNVVLCRY